MKKNVLIIAEAGVNHNGSFDLAMELISVAAKAGADFVKFQTFKADRIVTRSAKKANYQVQNYNDGEASQFAMLQKLEMPEQWHSDLIRHASACGIGFLSTGFDEHSVDFLDGLSMSMFKIPSGEITNKSYLQHIARKGKPLIMSTGMANMDEIKQAIAAIEESGLDRRMITVLHCNTEYPTPMEDVNLLAMQTIAMELRLPVGYSDHTLGIEVPVAAVALGATVIEKHFTIDAKLPGPDHAASIEPSGLAAMVQAIRNIEKAISGNGEKVPTKSEMKNLSIVRKSLHFNRDLKSGHILSATDLVALRPGDGMSPMKIDLVIGKRLLTDVTAFDQVNENQLQ